MPAPLQIPLNGHSFTGIDFRGRSEKEGVCDKIIITYGSSGFTLEKPRKSANEALVGIPCRRECRRSSRDCAGVDGLVLALLKFGGEILGYTYTLFTMEGQDCHRIHHSNIGVDIPMSYTVTGPHSLWTDGDRGDLNPHSGLYQLE
jgi:hypothetical protein